MKEGEILKLNIKKGIWEGIGVMAPALVERTKKVQHLEGGEGVNERDRDSLRKGRKIIVRRGEGERSYLEAGWEIVDFIQKKGETWVRVHKREGNEMLEKDLLIKDAEKLNPPQK